MDLPLSGEFPPDGQQSPLNGEARGTKRKRKSPGHQVRPLSVDDPVTVRIKKRLSILSKLYQRLSPLENLESLWKLVLEALKELDSQDLPFSLLYSVRDRTSNGICLEISPKNQLKQQHLALEGSIGLHENSLEALQLYNLVKAELYKEPQDTEPQILKVDKSYRSGYTMCSKPSSIPSVSNTAMLCPIRAEVPSPTMNAFLILGLPPPSLPDTAYTSDLHTFIQTLTSTINTLATTILLRQHLSAAHQELHATQNTSQQLAQRVTEAERSTFMFRHMAESATVGCAIFSPSGTPLWLNEAYLNLTGVSRAEFGVPGAWQQAIVEEDRALVLERWRRLAAGDGITPFAFRVKRLGGEKRGGEGEEGIESLGYRWLLSNAFVDHDEEGECRRVMGWLTDISAQKWSECLQARRLEDALETKRQTERFIDMVSHEIRNPLSAIIQTADGVLSSMDSKSEEAQSYSNGFSSRRESIVDAGKTIILCANHQKRIVDDILTLSKLDSNLLVIAPNQVRPRDLVQNAIKMFEAELSSTRIEASISIDESYQKLSVDAVLLDESRVMQILLNLITNAIKFTRNRPERVIRVRLAASQSRPSIDTSEISYIAPRSPHLKVSTSAEARQKEEIYLAFSIEDTGPGLGKDDMRTLFQRFSQASPKTYSYGGFGLGLFICRELAELQGGQIGLSSVLGQGTAFTFYVQARRCTPEAPRPSANANVKLLELSSNSPNGNGSVQSTTQNSRTGLQGPRKIALNPHTLHVLVVEDNKINQNVLARQLRLLGCKVHTADHGLEALNFLAQTTFFSTPLPDCQPAALDKSLLLNQHGDEGSGKETPTPEFPIPLSVILLDLEMPIMDGLACVRRIREMQNEDIVRGHVPVIAVTANARSEQIAEAKEAGMDAVLTKPFHIPELLPKIAAVMGGGGQAESW